jgi:hypothetical protein
MLQHRSDPGYQHGSQHAAHRKVADPNNAIVAPFEQDAQAELPEKQEPPAAGADVGAGATDALAVLAAVAAQQLQAGCAMGAVNDPVYRPVYRWTSSQSLRVTADCGDVMMLQGGVRMTSRMHAHRKLATTEYGASLIRVHGDC